MKTAWCWIVGLLFMALSGCAGQPRAAAELQRFEYNRLCMGVRARIVLYAENQQAATAHAAAAFERLADLDAIMSDYRLDSELNRLAQAPMNAAVVISPDLHRVLSLAQHMARESHGAFDVTAGPLTHLWRQSRARGQLPSDHQLHSAQARSGWQSLEVSPGPPPTARLSLSPMQLDLGGIAKGDAAQQAVELLMQRGVRPCLVALAGDVVVGDPPPGKAGWIIDLDPALAAQQSSIELANAAISTSGDSQQHITVNGVRYGHIVDPRTGLGLSHSMVATVIAPRGELADALATTACVLGHQQAHAFMARHFPEVILLSAASREE